MPEGVSQIEIRILDGNITAFFKCALAVGGTVKAAVSDHDAAAPVKGALLVHHLVLDYPHKHLAVLDKNTITNLRADLCYGNNFFIRYIFAYARENVVK